MKSKHGMRTTIALCVAGALGAAAIIVLYNRWPQLIAPKLFHDHVRDFTRIQCDAPLAIDNHVIDVEWWLEDPEGIDQIRRLLMNARITPMKDRGSQIDTEYFNCRLFGRDEQVFHVTVYKGFDANFHYSGHTFTIATDNNDFYSIIKNSARKIAAAKSARDANDEEEKVRGTD